MADKALLHISADQEELFGVWVNTTAGPEGYYPAGEEDGDFQYGQALVGDTHSWAYSLDHLPRTGGYICHWGVVECGEEESAKAIYDRVLKEANAQAGSKAAASEGES